MSEAIHYVVLVPSMVPLAVNFYIEVFQATKISDNDDGSVQLRINDSNVLVTPGTPPNSLLIELVLDRDSRQKIRQDARFVEIEREQDVETYQTSVKMRDPYGVFWLLNEKEYSDVYRCIGSCENCNLECHLPALCDEMKAWYYYVDIYNHIDACEICKLELHPPALCEIMKTWSSFQFASFSAKTTFQTYRTLQEEMSQIRNLRFSYESEDFDLFTNHPTVPLRWMIAQLKEQTLRRPMSAPFPSWSTIFRVSPEVLGVIKLTAMFAARYGKRIGWELMEKVGKRPLFSFLDPSDHCGFTCYNMVVKLYSKVLESFELLYTTDIVLERYFQCLPWDESNGELKDLDDLYSFVECVDSFAQMEDQDFYHFMGNLHPHWNLLHDWRTCPILLSSVYPFHDQTSLVHSRAHVLCPFHHETSPANVQEEGSSSVEVSVPTVNGRKVLEITVDSWLLEKVASLKEKIAKMMQMQAKELKLRSKSGGVLKEDKSLADNNVEAGEMLTATWRFSRWEV